MKNKRNLKGQGDYSEEILSIERPLQRLESKIDHLEKKLVGKGVSNANLAASTIGRTLGNFVGQGDLGAQAGSSLAKLFGHGDYNVKVNSLMDPNIPTGAKFANAGRRGTRIIEREFVGNITAGALSGNASVFDYQSFMLNPTNANLFPWLSNIAILYDQWEPNGIVLEYISTSSEFNGASQALGAVIIATDYDPYDLPYSTKQEMENSDYACSTKPALDLIHGIECDKRERLTHMYYTSTDNGAPATAYSLGTAYVATQGCSVANVNLGELWISYDITFYKKQLVDNSVISRTLSATGTCDIDESFFANTTSVVDSTITLGASTVYLNNTVIGGRYVFLYRLEEKAPTDGFGSFVVNGGTEVTRQTFTTGSSLPAIIVIVFDTTILEATVDVGTKASSPETTWYLAVNNVAQTFTLG
jgi:hypothetical protein